MYGQYPVLGAGLALRPDMLTTLAGQVPRQINFLEVVPENWINAGGSDAVALRKLVDTLPPVGRSSSLDLGEIMPLDQAFLSRVKGFITRYAIRCYSGRLNTLTEHTVVRVADRVRRIQDVLGIRIAVECAVGTGDMTGIDFIRAVLEQADCELLLDLSRIHADSIKYGYDAGLMLKSLPGRRIAYGRVTGQGAAAQDPGADVCGDVIPAPVWRLLDKAYAHFGVFPVVLEREFNEVCRQEALQELNRLQQLQLRHASDSAKGIPGHKLA